MTQPEEASSQAEFLAEESNDESAVRNMGAFPGAEGPATEELSFFESSPASGAEAREVRVPSELSGDSTLSRYFREMATHQVMGPDEELQVAQRVEEAEIEHWTALLAYLPLAEAVLTHLEQDVLVLQEPERPNLVEIAELRRLLKVFKKQR